VNSGDAGGVGTIDSQHADATASIMTTRLLVSLTDAEASCFSPDSEILWARVTRRSILTLRYVNGEVTEE
jgi:hypothetical protein